MNLVFLYPHYLFFTETFSLQTSTASTSSKNIVSGSRSDIWERATSGASADFIADTNNLTDTEKNPNYMYVAGLNLSTQKGGTIQLRLTGADNSTITTNAEQVIGQDFDTVDLVGARGDDAIAEVTADFEKRYWRARLNAQDGNFAHELRKLYFGQWFYFGIEPIEVTTRIINANRKNLRLTTLKYVGIRNDKLQFFKDRILAYRKQNPVVMYECQLDTILDGETVRMALITNSSIRARTTNNNQIDIELTEVI